jgi:hypothetical protein
MFKPLKHPNVRILAGMKEFVGQTGVIIDKEGKQYRVKLDVPVEVTGVGTVTSDLWEPAMLKVIRPPAIKAPAVELQGKDGDAEQTPALNPQQALNAERMAQINTAVAHIEAERAGCSDLPTVFEEEQLLADMTLACQIEAPAASDKRVARKAPKDKGKSPKVKAPKAKKPKVERGAVIRRK